MLVKMHIKNMSSTYPPTKIMLPHTCGISGQLRQNYSYHILIYNCGVITQYSSTVYIGIAMVISIKSILKENSDLTFSFKLFPFLVTLMSKTYKKRINSPKINVFQHNMWEIQ